MSSSSSLAGASLSNQSLSTTTWQVEQASEPSQAPSTSMWLRWAISITLRQSGASTSLREPSFNMNVIFGISSVTRRTLHSTFQLAHRLARQGLADTAIHAPLGERLDHRFQRLGSGIDRVAVLPRHGDFQPRTAIIQRRALGGVEEAAVLGERSIEREDI